ncbi:acyltransferase [uncultured Megasphaera sp.]|uniref:acyltransferase family protein n=1 Tax=uncultured Megasphaera sp. TaxID=165188 RepID=UPI0025D866E9|nr:acyltransferase [uncultured Megasphaera sp.]
MKLPAIQGLRFLGFLMIFINHSYWLFSKNKWFDFGARGVEIFFVLSGFLMAYHYGNKDVAYDLKSSIRYMLRKAKKFYLLHLVTFFAMGASFWNLRQTSGWHYPGGRTVLYRDVILNLTLLKSWDARSIFSFNGVTWFLSVMLFIYLCLPFLIHLFKENTTDRGKAAVWFLGIFLVKIIGDTIGYTLHWNPWPQTFSYYANPAYRLIDFVLGYLGYQVLRPLNSNWGNLACSFLQVGSLIIYFLCCVLFDKIWLPAHFVFLSVLLITAFMLPDGIAQPIFGNRIMVHLGNISFELFIVHQVLISILANRLKTISRFNSLQIWLILFCLSIIMAECFNRRLDSSNRKNVSC